MPINEIFPNPTVTSVFFEVKFPNLFYMESKIGELQLLVIERFPESSLMLRKQFVFADVKLGDTIEAPPTEEVGANKIWQFKSSNDVVFNVQTNSLWISSKHHKTYNLGDGDKFREVIQFVINAFLSVTKVPLFTRIGLRYVDECPVPAKDNETFTRYYNTTFPVGRFNIADAKDMIFQTVIKRDNCFVRYVENLQTKKDGTCSLQLDFDGFRERISSGEWLAVADRLHEIISQEFQATIKEPVYEYMRQPKAGTV